MKFMVCLQGLRVEDVRTCRLKASYCWPSRNLQGEPQWLLHILCGCYNCSFSKCGHAVLNYPACNNKLVQAKALPSGWTQNSELQSFKSLVLRFMHAGIIFKKGTINKPWPQCFYLCCTFALLCFLKWNVHVIQTDFFWTAKIPVNTMQQWTLKNDTPDLFTLNLHCSFSSTKILSTLSNSEILRQETCQRWDLQLHRTVNFNLRKIFFWIWCFKASKTQVKSDYKLHQCSKSSCEKTETPISFSNLNPL